MPQHSLSFQNNIWFDDPFGLIRFEYDVEQVFNRTVSDALFALAERTPYLTSAEVRLFFRIDSAGCAFSTEAQAGFSFLCALDIESPHFEAMAATADDLVNKGGRARAGIAAQREELLQRTSQTPPAKLL